MTIDITMMLKLQKELDKNIEQKHNLNVEKELNKKKLALIIELSEMINVNRCFKYWSLKKEYDKDALGNEFVDCLHFILSLSIYYKMEKKEFIIGQKKYDDYELTNKFLEMHNIASNINSAEKCELFLSNLFDIAATLNMSKEEIINYYKQKNEVNFQRQKDNY